MSQYIDINNIAKTIQDRLNILADELYTEEQVPKKVTFYITANHYEYDRLIEDDFNGTSIPATIGLIRRTGTTMNEDFKSGTFVESYTIDIYGFKADDKTLEVIFDAYNYNENANNYEHMEGWAVFKQTERAMFQGTTESKDGEDRERIEYAFAFVWTFVLGGVLADETTIKIGNDYIDFLSIDLQSDKALISNLNTTKSTPAAMTGTRLIITIPAQVTTANQALFTAMIGKSYNQKFTLEWKIGTFHTHTKDYYLRGGGARYEKRQMIGYEVIFEEALPRTSWSIDGQPILIKEVTFQRDNTTEPKMNENNEINEAGVATTWAFQMTLVYDETPIAKELLGQVLDEVYDTPHTIQINVPGMSARVYNATIKQGTYTEGENGAITFDLLMVGRAVI